MTVHDHNQETAIDTFKIQNISIRTRIPSVVLVTHTSLLLTSPSSVTLGNYQSVHFYNFFISSILYKGNHIILNLSDWFCSLSIFLWRFIVNDVRINSCFVFFLLLSSILWYGRTTVFFNDALTEGHLGCFQFCGIMHKAAVDICV